LFAAIIAKCVACAQFICRLWVRMKCTGVEFRREGGLCDVRITAWVYNCAVTKETDMAHQFDVIVEKDAAGYFVASVPALPGCHTQAKSLDTLMERIREAIELCLEVRGDTTEPLDFVGVQRISVAA
jgi:predicted RNase H-like HicB family nuclease